MDVIKDIGRNGGRRPPETLQRSMGRLLLVFLVMLAGSVSAFAQPAPKPLVVGVDGTFAPHAMPKAGGGVEGFNVDLIDEIGRRLGRPVRIEATEFSGLIPAMNAGRLDFVGAPTTATPERARMLLFSEGYLNTYYQFIVPKEGADLRSLDALRGKTISVNKGSAYDKWAQDNAGKYGFRSESYPTNTDAVQAVLSGRADTCLAGNTVSAYAVVKNSSHLKLASLKIDEGLVWAAVFRRDDHSGRDQVEVALECIKQDGTLARLHEKWFGEKPMAGSAAVSIFPGSGVPGLPGYDPTPHALDCAR